MQRILRSAISGAVATVVMTVPVVAAQRFNVLQQLPPREISHEVARPMPLLPDARSPAFPMIWPLSHLAYGAAGGIVYGIVQSRLPGPPVTDGIVYGGIVWAAGYAGFLPAMNLYPSPADDSESRVTTMLLAHGVYGVATAFLFRRFGPHRTRGSKVQ